MKMISGLMAFFLCVILSATIRAEDQIPVEITADNALEWNQGTKNYVARGHAIAKKGDFSVTADTLTAAYEGKDGSTSDIRFLTAEGNVTLTSKDSVATGDKATYDLVTGEAFLTGNRPKVVSQNKNTIVSDQIKVFATPQKNTDSPSPQVEKVEAMGNVVVTNGEQVATGDKAVYNATKNTAELIGHVKIQQGQNWLQGDRAEIDLTTKVSRMSGQQGTGRVKGVFYPGAGKKR